MEKHILALPGDGVGPEVMKSAYDVIHAVGSKFRHTFIIEEQLIGGAAVDEYATPLPDLTVRMAEKTDAILLGAVGGAKWAGNPPEKQPEKGLLGIRKAMGFFANLRPVKGFSSLLNASPLKKDNIAGGDILIIRELTGGLYFGNPSERRENGNAVVDTLYYKRSEIERIAEQAFQSARLRRHHITSVDKANVLESSRMWREIIEEKSRKYPDVHVEHMLVDAAAMKLITDPKAFDVIVTENMFGDILSDEASVLTGSLGMLPSASIRSDGVGLYEPVHGSAPDIADQGQVNPAGMILSVAMMFRHSFQLTDEADVIERAVEESLFQGYFTADLLDFRDESISTQQMTEAVIKNITNENLSDSAQKSV